MSDITFRIDFTGGSAYSDHFASRAMEILRETWLPVTFVRDADGLAITVSSVNAAELQQKVSALARTTDDFLTRQVAGGISASLGEATRVVQRSGTSTPTPGRQAVDGFHGPGAIRSGMSYSDEGMSCGADRSVVGWKEAQKAAQKSAWDSGRIPTGWPRDYSPQTNAFQHGIDSPVKCTAREAVRLLEEYRASDDLIARWRERFEERKVDWQRRLKTHRAKLKSQGLTYSQERREAYEEKFPRPTEDDRKDPKPHEPPNPRLAEIPVDEFGDPDFRWFLTGPQAGKIVVQFSGGKDSLAMLLYVIEVCEAFGLDPREHVEAWHQAVDGRPEHLGGESSESRGSGSRYKNAKWDWPVTEDYCRAVCETLGISLYFGWREGGLQGTVLRGEGAPAPRAAAFFELPGGMIGKAGGESRDLGVRMSYPLTGADLRTRWCSSEAKIDVSKSQLAARDDLEGKRILQATGERAEESANRATYAEREFFGDFKVDTMTISGLHGTKGRHVEKWRPLLGWCELDVWAIIRRHGIVPHPAYFIGFGRLSCMTCIFGSKDQWATVRRLDPTRFGQFSSTEAALVERRDEDVKAGVPKAEKRLVTIKGVPLGDFADSGRPYEGDYSVAPLAMGTHYPRNLVRVSPERWILPEGAFRDAPGPT